MTLVAADRVKETTVTTGVGTVVLAGAKRGYQTFASGLTVGDECRYCITDGELWEVGTGTLVTGTTLSRDTILDSSAGGIAVNWLLGSPRDVFLTDAATDIFGDGFPLYIQDDTPAETTTSDKYMWVQTGLGTSGTDCTFWIEDGT